jgi:hypothetical protein
MALSQFSWLAPGFGAQSVSPETGRRSAYWQTAVAAILVAKLIPPGDSNILTRRRLALAIRENARSRSTNRVAAIAARASDRDR